MKAILVFDLPNDIFIDDCRIEYRVIENVMEMCVAGGIKRLKPMPQKMKVDYDTISSAEVTDKVVAIGYNACIEAILGGNE